MPLYSKQIVPCGNAVGCGGEERYRLAIKLKLPTFVSFAIHCSVVTLESEEFYEVDSTTAALSLYYEASLQHPVVISSIR